MRKAWLYKRKDRPGWYVHWYDSNGKQTSKRLPNKPLAEQYLQRLQHRMNEDIYVDPVIVSWGVLVEEYIRFKQDVKGLAPGSIESITHSLNNFRRICGPVSSTELQQSHVNTYVAERIKEGTSKPTVNKDLRQLRAFVRWSIKNRSMGQLAQRIDWSDLRQQETKKDVRTLSMAEFSRLLKSAEKLYGPSWVIRILIATGTGLRLRDTEGLKISDIHLEDSAISTLSQKTRKTMARRPVHPTITSVLKAYIDQLPKGQDMLYSDKYHHSKWKRILAQAKIDSLKYHDLRSTFGSFVLLAGFSTAVVQSLLEHSTPNLTHAIYTNVSPAYRDAANAIPVDKVIGQSDLQTEWLSAASPEHPQGDSEPCDPSNQT